MTGENPNENEKTVIDKAKEKAEMPDVYSIVTTTRAKYFGVVKQNGGKGIVIESAYELKNETEPQVIAKSFIKGQLYGDNKRIELSDGLVESVTDAPDETRILKTYDALIPEAKKRAIGMMTYKALDDLLQ